MWRIAATESRMLWRRGLFRWAGGVLLALLSISLLLALDNYHRRSVAAEFATGAQRDQWLHKHIVNPHVAAHAGTVLFRPLDSLTVLDSGVDPFLGTSVFLEAHRRSMLAHPSAQRVPAAGRFAELTAAITLQTLVPLLIVLLTTPAFAGEREHGTLRHLLSLGVSARAVLLGKAAGVTAPILGLVFPLMLMGVVAVSINAPLDALRAMLLAVAYVLYVFVWIGLGLGISVRSRSSHSALAAALALWIVGCFIVPRVAFAAVQRVAPAVTPQQFVEALEDESGEGAGFLEQRKAIEERLLKEHGVSRPIDLPVSTWGMTLYEREVDSTKRYNEQFARLFDRYERQQRLVDVVSVFCPPLAVRTVSMALAATDVSHYRDFAEAAERYRYTLVQRMNQIAVESRLYNSSPTFANGPDRPVFPRGEEQAYASVGPFSYRPPGAAWALSRVAVPASALVLWSIAVAVLLWPSGRRINVD
jgi:ABC-2 type transport system permease protein